MQFSTYFNYFYKFAKLKIKNFVLKTKKYAE